METHRTPTQHAEHETQEAEGHTIKRAEMIARVAEKTGMPEPKVEKMLSALWDMSTSAVAHGDTVELDIGWLSPGKVAAGKRTMPNGRTMEWGEGKTMRLRPKEHTKRALNA